MRSQQEFLIDVFQRLNGSHVEYMLTGSMACNLWGTPRTTHDLDIVVAIERDQIDRLVTSFQDGFEIQAESVSAAIEPPFRFHVLDIQSALRIDFWQLGQSEFEQEAFRRKLSMTLFGVEAWVATAEDMLLLKLQSNHLARSETDRLDAAGVYAVQRPSLDIEYIQRWAGELGVSQILADLIAGRLCPKNT